MIRALLVACLLGLALSDKWGTLQHCTHDDKGYCFGYLSANPKQWCWLTSDGEKTYVKEGTAGYACKDYDKYKGNKYCEGAKSFLSLQANPHASSTHGQPITLGKLKGSTKGKDRYCFGYMAGKPGKWCWLTSDGMKDFVKEGTGGHSCSSYDTYEARTYCENAQSSADATLHQSIIHTGSASGAFGINTIIAKNVGKNSVNCKRLCKYFGSGSHTSAWSSSSTQRITTCTCGAIKVVKVACSTSTPFTYCKLDSVSGYGTPAPPPAPPAPAGQLHGFVANFGKNNDGKRVHRVGETRTECWDLAMAAIESANRNGFNVGAGHMAADNFGYVWSNQVVPHSEAKPGDIAQFASWSEHLTTATGYSSQMTGPRHTAIVTGAYDATNCAIEMYDQNPSPTHRTVYHTCKTGGYVSGTLDIYRLTSDPPEVEHRLYSEFAAPQMKVSTSLQIIGCGMAVAMVSFGFVVWRAIGKRYQTRSQNDMQLLITEETDPEMLDAATVLE